MRRNDILGNKRRSRFAVIGIMVAALIAGAFYFPFEKSEASEPVGRNSLSMYRRLVKDVDLNADRAMAGIRTATSAQAAALNQLRSTSPNLTARWNDFGGSPDVIRGFASQTF